VDFSGVEKFIDGFTEKRGQAAGDRHLFRRNARKISSTCRCRSPLRPFFSRVIDTPAKRYSSGMRVRLAFSVAAHLEPEILPVDDAPFQIVSTADCAYTSVVKEHRHPGSTASK